MVPLKYQKQVQAQEVLLQKYIVQDSKLSEYLNKRVLFKSDIHKIIGVLHNFRVFLTIATLPGNKDMSLSMTITPEGAIPESRYVIDFETYTIRNIYRNVEIAYGNVFAEVLQETINELFNNLEQHLLTDIIDLSSPAAKALYGASSYTPPPKGKA